MSTAFSLRIRQPSSHTLSFTLASPLASATSYIQIPSSLRLSNLPGSSTPLLDILSLPRKPTLRQRRRSSSSFRERRRRLSLVPVAPPSSLAVSMCRPSSSMDRFRSPKKITSHPMDLPDGLETLKDVAPDDGSDTERSFAFLLDYDGTLTPIVDDPDKAIIGDETRDVIRDLADRFDTAIVTGRSLQKIQQLVKVEQCYYAGAHGWDIQGPVGSHLRKRVGEHYLKQFETVLDRLDDVVDDRFPGASVEDNTFSISIHYRGCDPNVVDDLEEQVERIAHDAGMIVRDGKKVFEIRPAFNWHKGKAVDFLVNKLQEKDENIVPIFIGDDHTDEDAFKALNGRGISIIVADGSEKRSTFADLRLNDPGEVKTFLSYFARQA